MAMAGFVGVADVAAIEAEGNWDSRERARTIHQALSDAKAAHGSRPAVSFQLTSGAGDAARTLSWSALHAQVTQAANLFRSLGIGAGDTVAFVLPNSTETVAALLGGMVAGVVNPINPLLEPDQIAAILRETKAKVVVTLRAFPRTDLPQRVAAAVAMAPGVNTVLELDLRGYLAPPKSWLVSLARPKNPVTHGARVTSFASGLAGHRADALDFADPPEDRVAAFFHTGGTTGMPKVAQHRVSGMIYNGWLGARLLFNAQDVVMCPLPLFHVFAVYPILMSMIASGAHVIFPTPAGYRGEGVFDNLWKLIERWRVTYLVTVPTALSALMQRKVDADISSLRSAFSGSAPLPLELFRRFEAASGVQIVEGYGLTEATCLVSINPPAGVKKTGSVGVPFPYTRLRIVTRKEGVLVDCPTDEIGEICVASPGVIPGSTYTEPEKNGGLYVDGAWLRTGDLGRIDADGYLFITGRAKDLIIRGGHNIDPATIEEAMMRHPAVAFAGAIGQPDAHAGELPCVYVELARGATADARELAAFAGEQIPERAAVPKHVEVLAELPKTAVGKVFKPDLRRRAIIRVLDAALTEAGLQARVVAVVEDRKRGLVAQIAPKVAPEAEATGHILGRFALQWDWKA